MDNQDTKSYKNILKDSFENPNLSISREQRYELATGLLRAGRVSSDNIIKIASMLNRKPNDSYYITYGILMQYNDKSMEDLDSAGKQNRLSMEKKADALEESCQIISDNIENKEFMDQIYNDVRLGTNIEKIYYPKQLKKDLIQVKSFTAMLNKLKTSERF